MRHNTMRSGASGPASCAIRFLLCSVVALSATAQTAPPPPDPEVGAASDKAASAAPKWKEDATVGAQLDEGRAGTEAVNITGDVWKPYSVGIIRFDVGESYGSISVAGTRITSIDSQYGSFAFTHYISKKLFFTQIDSIERDTIRLIDYRASSLNALGIRLKKGKAALDFGPGIAPVDQQKHTPQIDGFKVDAGAFYSLVYDVAPRWQITNWGTYRNDVTHATDRLIDSSTALTGMITKTIGMRVAVSYNYEGVLPTGTLRSGFATRNFLTTTIGLTIRR